MTVLDRVSSLLRQRSPHPLCDDCIAELLELSVRQHANHKTRELAKLKGFRRVRGTCQVCKNAKLVIGFTAA